MVSAFIVYSALGALFIMQCITLVAVIRSTRAKGQEKVDVTTAATSPRDRERDQRDKDRERRDWRPDNRPQQHNRPAPQPSASPVDKSLREINLRLRNAERDQERARRTIDQSGNLVNNQQRQENRFRDKPPFGQRRDQRDNRDRGNREQRDTRDNWQRNRDREPPRQQEIRFEQRPQDIRPEPRPQAPVFQPQPASMTPAGPVTRQDISPAAVPAGTQAPVAATAAQVAQENLEHGRKITVKRRVLPNEGNGAGIQTEAAEAPSTVRDTDTVQQQQLQQAQTTAVVAGQQQDAATQTNSEVSFGRR